MLIYILDLVSVFAFAFFGARVGLKNGFNLLGIIVCAFLPALGGGTIRELLLNHSPMYFGDSAYGIVVLIATAFALASYKKRSVVRIMHALDALGAITFSFLGSLAAEKAGLGMVGCISFALLTACGGGILCELLTRQVPHMFKNQYYALPPALFGGLYWICGGVTAPVFIITSLFLLMLALQLVFTFNVTLPHKSRLHSIYYRSKLLSHFLTNLIRDKAPSPEE